MTALPDGGLPPGIVQALTEASKLTGLLMILGGAFAWVYARVERRFARKRAEKRLTEEERLRREKEEAERQDEERRFYDERARHEILRLEGERDAARAECRRREQQQERHYREVTDAREKWIVCLGEARRVQQLVLSIYRMPAMKGLDPPVFDPLPDPWPHEPLA